MPVHEFYLMRHGQAEPHGVTDEERELTTRGARQAESQGRALDKHFADSAEASRRLRIIQSPYLRARETAELVRQQANCVEGEPITVDGITPEDTLEDALAALSEAFARHPEQHFLVVCHMPIVAMLDGHCVEASTRQGKGFSTAEIRRYRFPDHDTYLALAAGCAESPSTLLRVGD